MAEGEDYGGGKHRGRWTVGEHRLGGKNYIFIHMQPLNNLEGIAQNWSIASKASIGAGDWSYPFLLFNFIILFEQMKRVQCSMLVHRQGFV